MAPRLAIQMTANSSQFKSEMLVASNAVKEAGSAVQAAKEIVRKSFREQVEAAREVGASQQELQAITARCAEAIADAEEVGAARVEAAERKKQSAYMASASAQRAMLEQARANNAADTKRFTSVSSERGTASGERDNTAVNQQLRIQWEQRVAAETISAEQARAAAIEQGSARAEAAMRGEMAMRQNMQSLYEREQAGYAFAQQLRAQMEAQAQTQQMAAKDARVSMAGASFGSGFFAMNGFAKEAKQAAEAVEGVAVASGHVVPATSAASATLRALEGNFTNNIRAGERFLTLFAPMRNLMQAAFPYIGAAVLGVALFEMGEKAYRAIQNVVMLKSAIEDLNKAELDTAKAVQSADERRDSAIEGILRQTQGEGAAARFKYQQATQKKVDLSGFFSSQEISGLPDDVKGSYEGRYKAVSTGDVSSRLADLARERRDLEDKRNAVNGRGPDAARAAFGELDLKVGGYGPSSSRNLDAYYKARLQLNQQTADRLQHEGDAQVASLQQMQLAIPAADKQDADKRASASRKGMAADKTALREAMEEQRKAWDEQHAWWEVEADRTKSDEAGFWLARAQETQRGSDNYRHALEQAGNAIRDTMRETLRMKKENQHLLEELDRDYTRDLKEDADKRLQQASENNAKWFEAERRQAEARQAAQRSMQDRAVSNAVSTGYLGKKDASALRAQLEQERYREDREALEAKYRFAGHREYFGSDAEQKTALATAGTDLVKLDAEHARAVMEHEAELAGEGWRAGMRKGVQGFVEDAEDGARQAQQMFSGLLSGTNQALATAFSELGDRHHRHVGRELGNAVGGTFRNFGSQIAMTGLQRAESGVMKALGLGKADGSRGNPFSVFVVNGPGGSGWGITGAGQRGYGVDLGAAQSASLSSLSSILDSQSKSGGGMTGDLLQAGVGLLTGARAAGGPVYSGKWLVGEHGPEVLDVGGSGYVTPNDRLPYSGGGRSVTQHIDARGSSDPAQTRVQARRGAEEGHAKMFSTYGDAQQEEKRRRPLSSR